MPVMQALSITDCLLSHISFRFGEGEENRQNVPAAHAWKPGSGLA